MTNELVHMQVSSESIEYEACSKRKKDDYGVEVDEDQPTGPLSGQNYVVTGVFDHISREKLEAFIQEHGG